MKDMALPRHSEWDSLSSVDVWPQVGSTPKNGDLFLAARKEENWNHYIVLLQYHGAVYEQVAPTSWTLAETGCAVRREDFDLLLQVSSTREERSFQFANGARLRPEWVLPRVATGETSDQSNLRPAVKSNAPGVQALVLTALEQHLDGKK